MGTIFVEDQYAMCDSCDFEDEVQVKSLGREQFEWNCPECGAHVITDRD